MGKIFFIIGKSASGKDTVYQRLIKELPQLKTVILYTTRPIREGERNGVEYIFSTTEQLEKMRQDRKLIECRTYETVYGPWSYFTVDDGQLNLANDNYLMIGTLESYQSMRSYFGNEFLIPVYLYVDPVTRIERALEREKKQQVPRIEEMCRRYLADEQDFSDENMRKSGIFNGYKNNNLEDCIFQIKQMMKKYL